ncbi:MAG TPA: hypothetical protein VFA18_22215 [Gemmataceae bacterium]|nr:hypothetical protein [Gemmataceae bacterium]
MTEQPDDFDRFLEAPLPAGNPELRSKLLVQTTGVVRRRRYVRRAGLVATLAACYLAGMLTMRWTAPGPPPPEVAKLEPKQLTPKAAERPSTHARTEETAVAMEYRALDSSTGRAALYRQAGDRYEQNGDMASAVRCYRNAVKEDSASNLTISADDDWLLMALKEAKRKEMQHEQHNG